MTSNDEVWAVFLEHEEGPPNRISGKVLFAWFVDAESWLELLRMAFQPGIPAAMQMMLPGCRPENAKVILWKDVRETSSYAQPFGHS